MAIAIQARDQSFLDQMLIVTPSTTRDTINKWPSIATLSLKATTLTQECIVASKEEQEVTMSNHLIMGTKENQSTHKVSTILLSSI
jgi:hypothetical protein